MGKKIASAIIIIVFLAIDVACQKAILMSSSIGYYNIRQVNNIVSIYHHFRSNGFNDEDILLMIGEMQPCCQKNHMFSSLSFYDGEYKNIFKQVQTDYYQSQMNLQSVSRILMGYHPKFRLNKRKLNFNTKQPLFIYFTGHGGDLYFKIRQREALINQQFNAIFRTLNIKGQVSKTGLISDSCSAITPFENVTASNFIALGSSSFGEKSLSHGYDSVLNQPKTDDFSFYFDEILSGKALAKGLSNLQNWSFKDLQKYMDPQKLKVNSKLISNNISKNEKIVNFIKREQPEIKFRQLKNIKKKIDFFRP